MLAPGGGGTELGPGTVTVTADPSLLAADPGAMAGAASSFRSAAFQANAASSVTTNAAGRLITAWKGSGALAFHGAANDVKWYSESAADGLMGAALALEALAQAIAAAQSQARAALQLAGDTTDASARLDNAFASSQASAVAALPAAASAAQVADAVAPTSSQSAQSQALYDDATRAVQLMAQANLTARTAWQAAGAAFDAVTSQSPSVQLAATGVRVKDFSKSMDSAGMAILFLAAVGAASGIPGADDEDDESIASEEAAMADDPDLAADLEGETKMNVDGSPMDAAIAVDVQTGIPIGWSDSITIQEADEQAALDPATADLMDTSPFGDLTPEQYQEEYWDPTGTPGSGKGTWRYPENNGADPDYVVKLETFEPGETISRFGPPSGNFSSPEDTPWSERSLPPTSIVPDQGESSSYHVYTFTDKWASDPPPVVVTQSTTAAAFGQPGGGIQYQFAAVPGSTIRMSFQWLLDNHYLNEEK